MGVSDLSAVLRIFRGRLRERSCVCASMTGERGLCRQAGVLPSRLPKCVDPSLGPDQEK
jgi:hypothetical protein